MIKEELKPPLFELGLEERLVELKKTLQVIQNNIDKMPAGHLKISQKKNHVEFYHILEKGSSRGHYISVKETEFAARLAQKDYDFQLIRLLKREINLLETSLRQTDNFSEIGKLYDTLNPARQALIKPVMLTDEQYCTQWRTVTWERKAITEDASKYFTANEECVRSKSEVIIADSLLRHGVPYRYEFPIKLRSESGARRKVSEVTFYPDFLCLNLRTREEFYWEHFGLMDDEEYANNAAGKINIYAENGIFPGRQLILTMETQREPLNTRTVDKLIKEFLL